MSRNDYALNNFTDFLPEILPAVNGCPRNLIINAVRNACIEFCDKSNYWLYDIDLMNVIANVAEYELVPPDNTEVVEPTNVLFDGYPLDPQTQDWLDSNIINWRALSQTNPSYYMVERPGFLTLVPYPSTSLAAKLRVTVSLKPTRSATQVFDKIYSNHLETIAAGAKARLLVMPDEKWTNLETAAINESIFRDKLGSAKIAARKGHSRASLQVKPREFGL